MSRNSFLIATGDLLVLFSFGAAICYFREEFLLIGASTQLLISLVLSIVLGCFGPTPGEILEWILFFCLGIIAVFFYPYAENIHHIHEAPLTDMLITLKQALLYSFEQLSIWIVGIPFGLLFYKLSRYSPYRHRGY